MSFGTRIAAGITALVFGIVALTILSWGYEMAPGVPNVYLLTEAFFMPLTVVFGMHALGYDGGTL